MPKEPASFSTGDAPPYLSSQDDGSSENSASAPFSTLSSLKGSHDNSLDSMPAFPSLQNNEADLGAIREIGITGDSLAELAPIPDIASKVSQSLFEQDKQNQHPNTTKLPPIPTSPLPVRLSPSGRNNHTWEPALRNAASKEKEPSISERAEKNATASPSFADEDKTELTNKAPSDKARPTGNKSPLARAELLDKIRNKRPHQELNDDESPFKSISSETSDQKNSSRSTAVATSTATLTDDVTKSSSTPFAETEQDDTTIEQSKGANDQHTKYTDKDLQNALRPLLDASNQSTFNIPTNTDSFLEPMLRSTVRRAIAEQMAEASPFRDVPGWNKLAWKIRALMSSRTYDDILFDQTRRYQVEEVFLLRPQTRSLISYASNNPARHAKSSKVESTIKKIATKTATIDNHQENTLEWGNDRQLVIRPGKHSMLAAIVHGSPNYVLEADLDYLLLQVEDRLGESLGDSHQAHLQILQPMLECCLLIQSLATSN